jgi:predicted DNA-binding protein
MSRSPKKLIAQRFERHTLEAIQLISLKTGITRAQLIRGAVENFVENYKNATNLNVAG